MRPFIARIVAAISGGIVAFLAGTLGLPVSEEAATFIREGITALGMAVWLVGYAVVHRLISRVTNPNDVAKEPAKPGLI